MLWRCAKVFMVIFASCELVGTGTVAFSKTERAIWSTMALVDGNARNAFLSAVTKFADKEAFAIRTSQPRDDGTHFLVQMWIEKARQKYGDIVSPYRVRRISL
jgi:hypothetical protein